MRCQYCLLFLFLVGFAARSVSEECNLKILEGTSCTIKLPTKNIDNSNEIKWIHLSGDAVIHRRNGKIKKPYPGLTIEEDGSLKFERVIVKNSGTYKYTVINGAGIQIDAGEKEINVYAKAPKPTLRSDCNNGVKLICDAGDPTDLTFSWYKDRDIIQDKKDPELVLSPEEVKDNKPYTCSVSNPVSSERSDGVTVSCSEGESPLPGQLIDFDFWIMVSFLSSGGALLLLLICVVICACRICKKKKQQEEREFRMRYLQAPDQETDSNASETYY